MPLVRDALCLKQRKQHKIGHNVSAVVSSASCQCSHQGLTLSCIHPQQTVYWSRINKSCSLYLYLAHSTRLEDYHGNDAGLVHFVRSERISSLHFHPLIPSLRIIYIYIYIYMRLIYFFLIYPIKCDRKRRIDREEGEREREEEEKERSGRRKRR